MRRNDSAWSYPVRLRVSRLRFPDPTSSQCRLGAGRLDLARVAEDLASAFFSRYGPISTWYRRPGCGEQQLRGAMRPDARARQLAVIVRVRAPLGRAHPARRGRITRWSAVVLKPGPEAIPGDHKGSGLSVRDKLNDRPRSSDLLPGTRRGKPTEEHGCADRALSARPAALPRAHRRQLPAAARLASRVPLSPLGRDGERRLDA